MFVFPLWPKNYFIEYRVLDKKGLLNLLSKNSFLFLLHLTTEWCSYFSSVDFGVWALVDRWGLIIFLCIVGRVTASLSKSSPLDASSTLSLGHDNQKCLQELIAHSLLGRQNRPQVRITGIELCFSWINKWRSDSCLFQVKTYLLSILWVCDLTQLITDVAIYLILWPS